MTQYDYIAGLEGREPVGAVLRIGRKGDRGFPIERDQFYVSSRYENEHGIRPLLADFAAFNNLAPEHRRAFRAILVHAEQGDAFNYHLSARALKRWKVTSHPNMRPVCSGDGERATRLYGIAEDGTEDWQEIDCPNDLCEFRQSRECKPWAKLYFQPRWSEKWERRPPSPLMVYVTQSWNTIANLKGLFDHVRQTAEELSLPRWSYMGLPILLELGEKKDKKKGHVYPVVAASVDGSLTDHFAAHLRLLEEVQSAPQLVGAVSEVEQDEVIDAADYRDITPGIGQGEMFK